MVGAVTLVRLLHLVQRQGDWTFIAHVHIIDSIFSIENITIMCLKKKQEAHLSQRDRAMLLVIEYFTKSLKVTQGHWE